MPTFSELGREIARSAGGRRVLLERVRIVFFLRKQRECR